MILSALHLINSSSLHLINSFFLLLMILFALHLINSSLLHLINSFFGSSMEDNWQSMPGKKGIL